MLTNKERKEKETRKSIRKEGRIMRSKRRKKTIKKIRGRKYYRQLRRVEGRQNDTRQRERKEEEKE